MIQKKYTHSVSLTVTARMYEQLKDMSDSRQCSIAKVIRNFLKEGLEQKTDSSADSLN